ncbi:hypothetical protein NDU88_009834 [Pleurodeles waltl]|uniref:Uncharacterized protein n=1 Tax=Pleurodeles waltl TaxID=8319 RepID=A0AAV7QSP3_PLEWA|nr:hypothetical protein NDU88_009834 [Pleurodeles waltl]
MYFQACFYHALPVHDDINVRVELNPLKADSIERVYLDGVQSLSACSVCSSLQSVDVESNSSSPRNISCFARESLSMRSVRNSLKTVELEINSSSLRATSCCYKRENFTLFKQALLPANMTSSHFGVHFDTLGFLPSGPSI